MKAPDQETPEAFLQAGIDALKAGQRLDAQNLIFKAIAHDPTYVKAWLWMSEAYTELEERIRCLEQVVSLDPENENVQAKLQALRKRQIGGWLEEGYDALEDGDPAQARETLMRVIEINEENLDAWWGLAHASESVEDQIICLENVLTLDPDHGEARERLAQLQATVGDSYGSAGEQARGEIDLAVTADSAEEGGALDLDDELACPYCGEPTAYDDRTCDACHRRLWVKERKPAPTPLYWILSGLELALMLIAGMVPLLLISILDAAFVEIDARALIAHLAGQSVKLPGVPVSEIVSLDVIRISLVPAGLSLLALLCSVSQWSPAYIAGSVLSALRALVGLSLIVTLLTTGFLGKPWESLESAAPAPGDAQFLTVMAWGVPVAGALIVGLSVLSIWSMMRLHTHFSTETRRMLLAIDRDVVKREVGLWLRAREYAKRKAWALAALHVRSALAYRVTIERYLLLAAAYYHLGRRDRARRALADAQEIQPDHPGIAAMVEQLERPSKDELTA